VEKGKLCSDINRYTAGNDFLDSQRSIIKFDITLVFVKKNFPVVIILKEMIEQKNKVKQMSSLTSHHFRKEKCLVKKL
jgi:hypothetical protein